MPVLIAKEALVYNDRRIAVGDPFTALSEDDARVLILVGKAHRDPGPPGCIGFDGPDGLPGELGIEPERPKRTYRRRNLTAQDTEA